MIAVLTIASIIDFYACMVCFVTGNTKVGDITLIIMVAIIVLLTVI